MGLPTLLKVGLGDLELIGEECRGYLVVLFGLATEGPTRTICLGLSSMLFSNDCAALTDVLNIGLGKREGWSGR